MISPFVIRQKKFFAHHLCILDIYKIAFLLYNKGAMRRIPQYPPLPIWDSLSEPLAEYQPYDTATRR